MLLLATFPVDRTRARECGISVTKPALSTRCKFTALFSAAAGVSQAVTQTRSVSNSARVRSEPNDRIIDRRSPGADLEAGLAADGVGGRILAVNIDRHSLIAILT